MCRWMSRADEGSLSFTTITARALCRAQPYAPLKSARSDSAMDMQERKEPKFIQFTAGDLVEGVL